MQEHSTTLAAFGLLGVVVTAIVAFFGGRNSAIAQLQTSINHGFDTLNKANGTKITELEGKIRQLEQYNNALARVLRSNGIDLPHQPEVTIVFAPFPEKH